MEYTKDTYQDGTINERYEGTPEEILKLIKKNEGVFIKGDNIIFDLDTGTIRMGKKEISETDKDNGLIYNQEDAIDFIRLRLKKEHEAEITEGLLRAILELEEDYMRSVGIIED